MCFRFDDPSATSDHALERRIVATFARHGIPLTVAVIPFRQAGERVLPLRTEHAAHLIEAQARGALEIAQHGHLHARRSNTPAGKPSELHALPYSEQRDLIAQGRERLAAVFGRTPAGFVPPWNAYDATTLAVLKDLGFRYVSGAWDVPGRSPAFATLPLTCWLHNLPAAVASARPFSLLNPLIVPALHEYDFEESGEKGAYLTIDGLGRLLESLRRERQIQFAALGASVESGWRTDFGFRCRAFRGRLPWRLRGLVPEHALLSGPRLPSLRTANRTEAGRAV